MASLVTSESLVDLFGGRVCMPFFMAQTFHNIWMSMTAFGISLFRFTCIWDNLLIFEKDKLKHLMKHIFVGEVIITSGLVSLSKLYFWLGIHCFGKTCTKKRTSNDFSNLWSLPLPKGSSFGLLLWIWTGIDINHSRIQWNRWRNSQLWKSHGPNEHPYHFPLCKWNVIFVWVHLYPFVQNKQDK